MKRKNHDPQHGWRKTTLLAAMLLLFANPSRANTIQPLALSLQAPAPSGGADCDHDAPAAGGGRGPVQESEHRPQPRRTYWLNSDDLASGATACVLRPSGKIDRLEADFKATSSISFATPLGDGPFHGANNVYVTDQRVQDHELVIRTAKWTTLHHNCGWGHKHKFDLLRIMAQSCEAVPLEIVVQDLWDANFHSRVTSGDVLRIMVMSAGRTVSGAVVTLTSENGWRKKVITDNDGRASLQLIRDYYPRRWTEFSRKHRANFTLEAEYGEERGGMHNGQPYDRVRSISTYSWHYEPARQDYSSWSAGLLIAALSMTISGFGVFLYRDRRRKPYRKVKIDE
ncbi:MAG: hypothetical protein HY885_02085 [Deltaproteobacteria bacterium]|nr:hypothetical protein [Deltaproteobacteria bacterium]